MDPMGYIDYKYKHVLYLHCILYFVILSHVIILIKKVRIHGRLSTAPTLSGNLSQIVFSHSCRFPIAIITS